MTLHDLIEQLSPQFPASVQKDVKTAGRVLAQALKYADAKSCLLEACLQPLPSLYRAVETFLTVQEKSPYTIRNTKNNLSRLFRSGETQGLISLLPAKPEKRFHALNLPRRHRDAKLVEPDASRLRRRDWPPEVEAEFATFTKWATDPLVSGRDARWKKRAVTLYAYEQTFEVYFGYLHHTLQLRPVKFDSLFDFSLIERFIYWQINEKYHRVTLAVTQLIQFVHAMASQYRVDPALRESLRALKKRLPSRQPFYNKSDSWVSLHELEQIGLALWPSKSPDALKRRCPLIDRDRAGQTHAVRAGISLMLRLWVHIPYRQRNMREMALDRNLYRTPDGRWRIRFSGEELKVSIRQGQRNIFDLPFPPTLIRTLESYLSTWRPLLAHHTNASEVFLNAHGEGFMAKTLRANVQKQVYNFTGRHWHPHLIRTTWATEWLRSSGDFMTAAIMLNDRLETVIQNYSHLRDENVAETAYEWVQKRINGH